MKNLENLILALCFDKTSVFDSMIKMASRGHTSGLDMSLGALVAVAAVRDRTGKADENYLRNLVSRLTS